MGTNNIHIGWGCYLWLWIGVAIAVLGIYEFVLTFALKDSNADPAGFTDALFEAGCDDATVGVGKRGSIALDFSREAPDAKTAIQSAIDAVQKAIPGAELMEAKPDLVNLSDMAEMVGCSRQNVPKYAAGEIRAAQSPFPLPAFTGTPDLWHLLEVVAWFSEQTELRPPKEVMEISAINFSVNLDSQRRRMKHVQKKVAAFI